MTQAYKFKTSHFEFLISLLGTAPEKRKKLWIKLSSQQLETSIETMNQALAFAINNPAISVNNTPIEEGIRNVIREIEDEIETRGKSHEER